MLGVMLPGDDVVIIGDTPSDIHCGRPIGARTIGVASGSYSTLELQQHNPFAVFEDLTDTDRVLDAILR
jgi:phosphoglycolate phosphatase-like HAD superfamily hydrolase